MTFAFPPTSAPFVKCVDCHAPLTRLIGNLSGFVYRRRHDKRWTMEFVSERFRDVSGYDPHRFIANQSLAWVDLIAPSDWKRVDDTVRAAVQERRRGTVGYLIRAAHGVWVPVEDRFVPIFTAAGQVLAIEGVIDRSRSPEWRRPNSWSVQTDPDLTVHSSN